MAIPTLRSVPYFIGIMTLLFLGSVLYSCGGKSVQADWDREKKAHLEAMQALKDQISELETKHRIETERINHELAEERRRYEVQRVRAHAEFDRRVRLSEERASIYQRQAENGSAQCRDLADHASRLDASLEEGRSLVRELRETLGFREQQLRAVSRQLLNDRALFNDEGLTDG